MEEVTVRISVNMKPEEWMELREKAKGQGYKINSLFTDLIQVALGYLREEDDLKNKLQKFIN